jgi:hypothetical protein
VSNVSDDWRLAVTTRQDLHRLGMPRANLLLVGSSRVARSIVEALLPDLATPVAIWFPGQPLELPTPGTVGTLLLHGVGALTCAEQDKLLEWLERSAGRTQLVSTTGSALLPLVEGGQFVATLYYRLNVICFDVSEPDPAV